MGEDSAQELAAPLANSGHLAGTLRPSSGHLAGTLRGLGVSNATLTQPGTTQRQRPMALSGTSTATVAPIVIMQTPVGMASGAVAVSPFTAVPTSPALSGTCCTPAAELRYTSTFVTV